MGLHSPLPPLSALDNPSCLWAVAVAVAAAHKQHRLDSLWPNKNYPAFVNTLAGMARDSLALAGNSYVVLEVLMVGSSPSYLYSYSDSCFAAVDVVAGIAVVATGVLVAGLEEWDSGFGRRVEEREPSCCNLPTYVRGDWKMLSQM